MRWRQNYFAIILKYIFYVKEKMAKNYLAYFNGRDYF